MASAYFFRGSIIESLTSTPSSGGNLVLTNGSDAYQIITGTQSHTVTLPDATTLVINKRFEITNSSTQAISVNDSGGNLLGTVESGSTRIFRATDISTANGVYDVSTASGGGGGGLDGDESNQFDVLAALGFGDSSRTVKYLHEMTGSNYWKSTNGIFNLRSYPHNSNIGGFLMISHGWSGGALLTAERYDIDSCVPITRASAATARAGGAGFSVGTKHYAVGGATAAPFSSNLVATNEEYDLETNIWATRAAVGTATLFSTGSFSHNGIGYAVGGSIAGPANTNLLYGYDPLTNAWHQRAPRFSISGVTSTSVYNGFAYAVGATSSARTDRFDFALNLWIRMTDYPTVLQSSGVAESANELVAAGGDASGYTNAVYSYHDFADLWRARSSLSSNRQTVGRNVGGRVIVAGGGDSGSPVSTVEIYQNAAFLNIGVMKRGIGVPTAINASVVMKNLSPKVPVQLRTDGDSWYTFESGTDPAKFGEVIAGKFQYIPELYWAGGSAGSGTNNAKFDDNGNTWTARALMNIGATSGSSFAIDGYSFQVYDDTVNLINQRYDSVANSYLTRSSMSNQNNFGSDGSGWSLQGFGYYAGGETGDATNNKLVQYDNTTDAYTQKANTTNPHRRATGFQLYNKIGYVGNNIASLTTSWERYSPVTNAWVSITDATNRRDNSAGASYGDKGYMIGGSSNGASANAQNSNYEYSNLLNTWATKATLDYNVMFMGAQSSNGQIFVAGGLDSGGSTLGSTRRFNPESNLWTTRTAMIAASADARNHPPGPYRSYEMRVGIPAYYAAVGGNVWSARTNMNAVRGACVPADVEGITIVTGNGLTAVDAYYKDINTWLNTVPMSHGRSRSAIGMGGFAYVWGGNALSHDRFNFTTKVWATRTVSNVAGRLTLVGSSYKAVNGFGLIHGGGDAGGTTTYPTAESYDQSTDAWTTKASRSNTSVNYSAAILVDGFYIGLPGMEASRTNGSTGIDLFNDAANSWTTKGAFPVANTSQQGALEFNGTSYTFGHQTPTVDSYKYNLATDVWSRAKNYPVSTRQPGATSSGLAAGGNNPTELSSSYQYINPVKDAVLSAGLSVT